MPIILSFMHSSAALLVVSIHSFLILFSLSIIDFFQIEKKKKSKSPIH